LNNLEAVKHSRNKSANNEKATRIMLVSNVKAAL
jgi:hypothetical protein